MNAQSRVSVRWPVLIVAGVVLLAVGAGGTYLILQSTGPSGARSAEPAMPVAGKAPRPADPANEPPAGANVPTPLPDVIVPLSQEAVKRAGIVLSPVTAGATSGVLVAPGVVQPNAYRQVVVRPLVSGRVTRVAAELGETVKQGQTIAEVFSPELADAQTRYISARAELTAHEQELARTEKLVAIGAASRQELERVHAGHTARRADLESAATRLRLLGLSAETVETLGPGKNQGATVDVTAPIAGTLTERMVNVGVNVDQSTPLFTVVDLSTVWVVVDLYENDFSRVRIGSSATITTRAYPELALEGRVSYIDPQVSPQTRTAKVRIEVANSGNKLRLGMYAEAHLSEERGASAPQIPHSAVQSVGDRTVVYLVNANKPGTFVEREVRLGTRTGAHVSVVAGVKPGDMVVGEGSFSLRAERERLGLRTSEGTPATGGGPAGERHSATRGTDEVHEAR